MDEKNDINEPKNNPISQWAKEDRPREKMAELGKKSLTDSELLAILLRTGIPGHSAIDLAKDLLKMNDYRLTNLAKMEINDLQRTMKGLGLAKAVSILAAMELGNRMMKEEKQNPNDTIHTSEDLFIDLDEKLSDQPREEFWAVYMNQRNKILGRKLIGVGGLTNTSVDVRIIFKGALEVNATSVAVAHNHPSGNLQPSAADKSLTKNIADAGKILNIRLIEHLILGILPSGKHDYFSFTEHGLL